MNRAGVYTGLDLERKNRRVGFFLVGVLLFLVAVAAVSVVVLN